MGKIQKKRSVHIPEKRTPARFAPQAPCAPRPERRTTDPQTGESPPGEPASRPVCGQDRKEHGREREMGQKEEKHRFFSGFRGISARIYFEAGISVAVTSARNGGQRRRKTASLCGFDGMNK